VTQKSIAPGRLTMLSAAQPTNPMTLGNYVGAVRHWARYQRDYDSLFFAVDQHAITIRIDPAVLRERTYRMFATYLAAGLDPAHSTLFVQSHVPAHAELGWVLGCHTYVGELNRMTQYKDKSSQQGANIGFGLLAYPTLMASDILLYQANLVPVGDDQKQHIELTRDLALRFNNAYERELFTVPEPKIPEVGARIMSLQDPTKKMSKSDPNPKATIFVTDTDKEIERKVKGAVTDSGSDVSYDESKPGVVNLINIQAALLGKAPLEVAQGYVNKQYGHLKVDTAEVVVQALRPIRDEAERLLADLSHLDEVMASGAEKAAARAELTLSSVYDALGFVRRKAARA
jgi:tryptophanyl-tRNA synthetase